jgi:hypothetical protein
MTSSGPTSRGTSSTGRQLRSSLAKAGTTDLTVGEALAVLLRTWNSAYYRFHPPGAGHYAEVEALIETHSDWLETVTHRRIASLADADEQPLVTVFTGFEAALGPVGAAKALHILAPRFMPSGTVRSRRNTPGRLGRQGRMRGGTSGSCRQPGNRALGWAVTPERPGGTF